MRLCYGFWECLQLSKRKKTQKLKFYIEIKITEKNKIHTNFDIEQKKHTLHNLTLNMGICYI